MPPELECRILCERLKAIYGSGISVCAAGSFALGGFVPGRSDINLLTELADGCAPREDPEPLAHDVHILFFRKEGEGPVFLGSRFLTGSHRYPEEETEDFVPPQDMNLMLSVFAGMTGMAVEEKREEETDAGCVPDIPPDNTGHDPLGDAEILPLYIAQARFSESCLQGELPPPVSREAVKDAMLHLMNRQGKNPDRVLLTLSVLAFLEEGLLLSKKGAGVYGMGKTSDPSERMLLSALVSFCMKRQDGPVPEQTGALLAEIRRRVWKAAACFGGGGTI